MPIVGEQVHIAGQDGVALAKRWLEATGRFEVRWHSGTTAAVPYLTVDQVAKPKVGFDILATHFGTDRQPRVELFAEVKNYNGPHDQKDKYSKFLAVCASAVAKWEETPPVLTTEFMWITWHPFGATKDYLKHVTPEMVREACEKLRPVAGAPNEEELWLPASKVTDALCEEVARRLWFVVAPRRLEDMLLDQTNGWRAGV